MGLKIAQGERASLTQRLDDYLLLAPARQINLKSWSCAGGVSLSRPLTTMGRPRERHAHITVWPAFDKLIQSHTNKPERGKSDTLPFYPYARVGPLSPEATS